MSEAIQNALAVGASEKSNTAQPSEPATPGEIAGSAAPAAPAPSLEFGLARLAWANVMPLWHRLGRGEGLLYVVNLSIVAAARPSASQFVVQAFISAAVLIVLYLLNDVFDCERDLNDPGKNQAFVRFLVDHRRRFAWLLAVEHVGLTAMAYALLGPRSGIATAAVFFVNYLYSASLKGRAAIDVPWVALWGALYAMVTGIELPLAMFGAVGVMTGIAHVFQITRDRDVDIVNGVRTSAVALRWMPAVQMGLLCVAMSACVAPVLGPGPAATALVPLILFVALRSNQAAWLTAKMYYGALWLLMLATVYFGQT